MNFEVLLNFEILNLSNKSVFLPWPKSHDKNLNILRKKGAFKMNYKPFFIIFKELSIKQKIILWGKESDFKKMLRQSSAANAWAAVFKNAYFS